MVHVKEAQVMSNDYSVEIFSYNSFKKRLQLIRSLENYSNKLESLIEKTTNIENISLKANK